MDRDNTQHTHKLPYYDGKSREAHHRQIVRRQIPSFGQVCDWAIKCYSCFAQFIFSVSCGPSQKYYFMIVLLKLILFILVGVMWNNLKKYSSTVLTRPPLRIFICIHHKFVLLIVFYILRMTSLIFDLIEMNLKIHLSKQLIRNTFTITTKINVCHYYCASE